MAVHTASTLVVPHRPHLELEFGIQSETNITTGFGSKSKTDVSHRHKGLSLHTANLNSA